MVNYFAGREENRDPCLVRYFILYSIESKVRMLILEDTSFYGGT